MSHGSCRITSRSQIIDFIFNDISQCEGHTTNRIKFKQPVMFETMNSRTLGSMRCVEITKIGAKE
jgi:hypothetical protein